MCMKLLYMPNRIVTFERRLLQSTFKYFPVSSGSTDNYMLYCNGIGIRWIDIHYTSIAVIVCGTM
jgi:hypothetical protein